MNLQFSPFPYLYTERLELRPIAPADDEALFFHRTDPDMNRYIDRERPKNLEAVRAFIEKLIQNVERNESIFWAISLRNATEMIGTICLWNLDQASDTAEIGYALHPDFQSKGYMQEAFEEVMDYGYNVLKANVIKAFVHPENAPSIRLLERNGLIQTGEDDGLLAFAK